MNQRAYRAMSAGGVALAFALAPVTALHSQSKPAPQGTWGTTPGQTNPGTTTTGAPTGTTPGQTTPTTTTSTTVNQSAQADLRADASFLREAASANLMEVRLGQSAQSKASNTAVKQFGQRMVNDHTNLENQLSSLVTNNGLSLSQSLSSKHQDAVNRLNKLSGQAFDSAYMTMMVQDHQEDIAKFQTQSQSAKSTQVRTLASNALPVLQQHLSLATQVRSQLGITGDVASDTTTTTTTANGKQSGNHNVQSDAEFIRDAGAGNAMFVQLSQTAEQKAKDNAVKQFAQQTRSDFEKLQKDWSKMASNNDMKISNGMGKHHHEKIETLQKASGKNFDETYMTIMVQQLHDRLSYWQKEGRASNSSQVRNLVNSGIPVLQQRYADAQRVARQIGVNPDLALKNRTDISTDKDKDKGKDNK
jgi:putative membrane protein